MRWLAVLLLAGCCIDERGDPSNYSCSPEQWQRVEEAAKFCKLNTDNSGSGCLRTATIAHCWYVGRPIK